MAAAACIYYFKDALYHTIYKGSLPTEHVANKDWVWQRAYMHVCVYMYLNLPVWAGSSGLYVFQAYSMAVHN